MAATEIDKKVNDVEAARILGLAPQTLRTWRSTKKKGAPRYLKMGSRVLYRLSDLEAFERANLHGGDQED